MPVETAQVLVHPACVHQTRVTQACVQINGTQNYFRLELAIDEDVPAKASDPADADVVLRGFASKSSKRPIVITEAPFKDNWFSHESRSGSIITVFDWEQL